MIAAIFTADYSNITVSHLLWEGLWKRRHLEVNRRQSAQFIHTPGPLTMSRPSRWYYSIPGFEQW